MSLSLSLSFFLSLSLCFKAYSSFSSTIEVMQTVRTKTREWMLSLSFYVVRHTRAWCYQSNSRYWNYPAMRCSAATRLLFQAVQPALEGPWADDIARWRLGPDAPVECVAALREIVTPDACASLLHMGLTEMHEVRYCMVP